MGIDDVIGMLGHSVSSGDARAAIVRRARTIPIGPAPWDKRAVLALLESLAEEEGALGISARFARSRLLLAK